MHRRHRLHPLTVASTAVLLLSSLLVMPPSQATLVPDQVPMLPVSYTEAIPPVRVRLSAPELPLHSFVSEAPILVMGGEKNILIPVGHTIHLRRTEEGLLLTTSRYIIQGDNLYLRSLRPQRPTTITSWDRRPAWDTSGTYNDNRFLGSLHIYPEGDGMIIVNELDMESYMRGIAEVPEQDEHEKRKALAVVSRSYAAHYLYEEQKFPDSRYNASDDPAIYQKYLGYGFTLRSPKWQEALAATRGILMTFQGEILRTAYSSCTDPEGLRKLPADVGWTAGYFLKTAPVYERVPDPLGVDPVRSANNQCGHGVGLSGLGATNMSKEGATFDEILSHYYKAFAFARLY